MRRADHVRRFESRRCGAVAVEGAIVLSIFLGVLMATLDIGLAAARTNALTECARRAGRRAIVCGKLSPASQQWGPAGWQGTAADSHPVATAIRPLLVTMRPSDVRIQLNWPDGGIEAGQRVRVELSYSHRPTVPYVLVSGTWNLTAATTMRVVH